MTLINQFSKRPNALQYSNNLYLNCLIGNASKSMFFVCHKIKEPKRNGRHNKNEPKTNRQTTHQLFAAIDLATRKAPIPSPNSFSVWNAIKFPLKFRLKKCEYQISLPFSKFDSAEQPNEPTDKQTVGIFFGVMNPWISVWFSNSNHLKITHIRTAKTDNLVKIVSFSGTTKRHTFYRFPVGLSWSIASDYLHMHTHKHI